MVKKIKIEFANYKDIVIISKLLFSENKNYLKFFSPYKNKDDLIYNFKNSQKDLFYIIKLDQNPIGYISLRGLDEGYDNPRFGIFVCEKFSNKGYGYEASKQLIKILRSENRFEYVDLKVNKRNNKATQLYKSLGFEFKRTEKSEDVMVLKLK